MMSERRIRTAVAILAVMVATFLSAAIPACAESRKPAPPATLKPSLYVLAIGISDYAQPDLRLGFAGKDATDVTAALQAQKGGLYGEVTARVLIDREATRDAVLAGLDWLARAVTSRDVAIVFLAGHSANDDQGAIRFLPTDAAAGAAATKGISADDLSNALGAVAGKVVVLLDASRTDATTAGGVPPEQADISPLVASLASSETGIVVFSAATGRELSRESQGWGNGVFAKALIEGIAAGKAALTGGPITLEQLDAYVSRRVPELTGGSQHPVMVRPPTVPDFPIAVPR